MYVGDWVVTTHGAARAQGTWLRVIPQSGGPFGCGMEGTGRATPKRRPPLFSRARGRPSPHPATNTMHLDFT
jgi:hypothetical protein